MSSTRRNDAPPAEVLALMREVITSSVTSIANAKAILAPLVALEWPVARSVAANETPTEELASRVFDDAWLLLWHTLRSGTTDATDLRKQAESGLFEIAVTTAVKESIAIHKLRGDFGTRQEKGMSFEEEGLRWLMVKYNPRIDVMLPNKRIDAGEVRAVVWTTIRYGSDVARGNQRSKSSKPNHAVELDKNADADAIAPHPFSFERSSFAGWLTSVTHFAIKKQLASVPKEQDLDDRSANQPPQKLDLPNPIDPRLVLHEALRQLSHNEIRKPAEKRIVFCFSLLQWKPLDVEDELIDLSLADLVERLSQEFSKSTTLDCSSHFAQLQSELFLTFGDRSLDTYNVSEGPAKVENWVSEVERALRSNMSGVAPNGKFFNAVMTLLCNNNILIAVHKRLTFAFNVGLKYKPKTIQTELNNIAFAELSKRLQKECTQKVPDLNASVFLPLDAELKTFIGETTLRHCDVIGEVAHWTYEVKNALRKCLETRFPDFDMQSAS